MTRLIITRHGNTFNKGELPRRVGRHTDIPLVESGIKQAQSLGRYLKSHHLIPDRIVCSGLKRTRQTAEHALTAMELQCAITADERFNEIDYGPDENQIEAAVIARLGQQALKQWDEEAIVPEGWQVDPAAIIKNWQAFADRCLNDYKDQTILVVTSNGIARFAPYLTGDFPAFQKAHTIKVATGALCVLENSSSHHLWSVTAWNIRPDVS